MWQALGKYRKIVISIALFLLLDASVLILNFYISFKIADDAVGVNLAGRQRMLTQRTVKALLDMQASAPGSQAFADARAELKLSHDLFDTTLRAFDQGGETRSPGGGFVVLQPVRSVAGRDAIDRAKVIWQPYGTAILATLSATSEANPDLLDEAIVLARAQNLKLLELMNALTVHLEQVATHQATVLRGVQTAGITLAVINFLIILFHFIGELRRNDQALDEARKETSDILNTVNEGLFLLDENLIVGQQHSARLEEMFGAKTIAGQSIAGLIGDLVKPKDMETAQRFISLLFRPDIKSNLIKDLNPLNEIEINLPDRQGGYTTLYLNFEFNRVLFKDRIKNVLVTVNDVSEKVRLERQLQDEKERNEQQLEMLTSILHTNPSTLTRFVQNAFDTFGKINELLKNQSKSETALRRKLDDMFIEIHNFKGEAAALGLDSFADHAHQFEGDIAQLRNLETVTGNDFLKLTVHLEKLIRYTESVKSLGKKLASFAVIDKAAPKSSRLSEWQHLFDLAKSCAERQLKDVELILTGFEETVLEDNQASLINDLCIQFIRNSVTHSIEPAAARYDARKPRTARVNARLARLPDGQLELSVRDDGRGIDYEKIRDKAKTLNKWAPEQIDQWGQKQLLNCIFEPGFSTAETTTSDAGRGVGMDVIRNKIRLHQGKLRIRSQFGQDCVFTVTLPARSVSSSAVA